MMKRNVIAGVLVVLGVVAWVTPLGASGDGETTHVFRLGINGRSWQTNVIINPGVKPPIGKVNNKTIGATLDGTLPDFAADYLPLDEGGSVYLLFDGLDSWRIATNTQGRNATTLQGRVANDGTFWMTGDYGFFGLMDATIFVQGKVKFAKGTHDPKAVAGTFHFISGDIGTGLVLKFKTVGQPLDP